MSFAFEVEKSWKIPAWEGLAGESFGNEIARDSLHKGEVFGGLAVYPRSLEMGIELSLLFGIRESTKRVEQKWKRMTDANKKPPPR